jgi:hypothetical protein
MVEALKRMTFDRYRSEVDQGFLPIISVEATENGNRTMSWRVALQADSQCRWRMGGFEQTRHHRA